MEEGLIGAWFAGEVVQLRNNPKSGGKALVRFDELMESDEPGAPNLSEWVPLPQLRPEPPPTPEPEEGGSGVPAYLESLEIGDMVELQHNGAWWSVKLKGREQVCSHHLQPPLLPTTCNHRV